MSLSPQTPARDGLGGQAHQEHVVGRGSERGNQAGSGCDLPGSRRDEAPWGSSLGRASPAPSCSPSPRRGHRSTTPRSPKTPFSGFSLPSLFLDGSSSHPQWLDHRRPPGGLCTRAPSPHLLASNSAPPKPERCLVSPNGTFHNWEKSTCHRPRPKHLVLSPQLLSHPQPATSNSGGTPFIIDVPKPGIPDTP